MKYVKYIILLYSLSNSFVNANKIAVATKIKGMVEIMPVGIKDFSNLKPGTILSDGDKIRTGDRGFAAIIFIDDKSTLKLKNNSEAVITGKRSAASISKKIDSGEGTLGRLVNDEEIYVQANKTLKTLNYLTEKVATGEGSLGKLVNDDQLYNSINELSANLNSVVAKVNSGEGTLGKLVNDDRLYYDALNSVRKLKNAVETQEDLAPLTTITAAFGVMTLF